MALSIYMMLYTAKSDIRSVVIMSVLAAQKVKILISGLRGRKEKR
jgi:hypothetical protein